MRIRQLKPSWWLDKPLRKGLTADEREFYIGLWQLADDAGWFAWDIERVAAELYPYAGVSQRERNVAKWSAHLAGLDPIKPHLVIYSCGHACVPKMPEHQRIAGKLSLGVKEKHLSCRSAVSLGEPKSASDSPGRGEVVVGNGTERNGTSREATPSGGLAEVTEFQARVPRPA